MTLFGAATRAWFADRFGGATDVQARGWAAIARGAHALLDGADRQRQDARGVPLGDRSAERAAQAAPAAARASCYVSPLKALVYDIERNLRVPLARDTGSGAVAPALTAVARHARRRAHRRHDPARARGGARAPGADPRDDTRVAVPDARIECPRRARAASRRSSSTRSTRSRRASAARISRSRSSACAS